MTNWNEAVIELETCEASHYLAFEKTNGEIVELEDLTRAELNEMVAMIEAQGKHEILAQF